MLALSLIFSTALILVCANAATTSEKVTMTITCEPEQALAFAGYSDGSVKQVEDWVAECKVYENSTKVYEGSFSATIPESRDAAIQEGNTVKQGIVDYLKQLRNADVPERE
jgi:hypothetical protein